MTNRIAALFLALCASQASAMPTGEWITRFEALRVDQAAGDPSAIDAQAASRILMERPEFKLLTAEFGSAVTKYMESEQAMLKAGKPRSCIAKGTRITTAGLITDIRRLPPGWQTRELSDTVAEALDRRYRCVTVPSAPAVISERFQLDIVPAKERGRARVVKLHGVATIEALVNGEAATMVVDNGFDRTTLDTAFARRLGLKLGPPTYELRTGRSVVKASLSEVATITLPRIGTLKASWLIVDLADMAALVGQPLDAILGNDVLGQLAVTITSDPHPGLGFHKSGGVKPRPLDGRRILNVPIVGDGQIEATINGQPMRLKIDLGYNGFITLNDAAWRRAFPVDHAMPGTGRNVTVDGMAHDVKTATARVKIGEMDVGEAPVDSYGMSQNMSHDGLLGTGLLLQGSMLLDQPARLLSLTLKPDAPTATPTP